MSRKRKTPDQTVFTPENDDPLPASGDSASTNGSGSEMVDMDRFMAAVSSRLVAVDDVALHRTEPLAVDDPVEHMQIMTFTLGNEQFAIALEHATEVLRAPRITPVPGLPEWVLGVTNLHGDILSVVDMGGFLNIRQSVARDARALIVVQASDQKIGLAVDEVGLIYTFSVDRVISPLHEVPPEIISYLRGVVDREQEFVHVLDCERLLLGPQMQQFF